LLIEKYGKNKEEIIRLFPETKYEFGQLIPNKYNLNNMAEYNKELKELKKIYDNEFQRIKKKEIINSYESMEEKYEFLKCEDYVKIKFYKYYDYFYKQNNSNKVFEIVLDLPKQIILIICEYFMNPYTINMETDNCASFSNLLIKNIISQIYIPNVHSILLDDYRFHMHNLSFYLFNYFFKINDKRISTQFYGIVPDLLGPKSIKFIK
jgi:hypothetical protein